MLARMYARRRRGYGAIGYKIGAATIDLGHPGSCALVHPKFQLGMQRAIGSVICGDMGPAERRRRLARNFLAGLHW